MAYVDRNGYKFLKINPKSTIITRSINEVREPYIIYNNRNWNFTHDYILRWLKGQCDEVILLGAADFETDRHFHSEKYFRPCQSNIENSIKFIEQEASKWFKIYKSNPKGKLNIPIREF